LFDWPTAKPTRLIVQSVRNPDKQIFDNVAAIQFVQHLSPD
jgi:cyclopropane fatty-acyl-phospholipid synthase-like methyltransferase